MSRLIAVDTLASSMLTMSRESVPAIRTKSTVRFDPSAATNERDPSAWSEPTAASAMADNSGIVSSGRPIMLA